ncbi:MAG: R3H domain-containing nucleic acid-binding protein [bacterium]|nr:R3H domain-containing nucleic acid-binding protein [bacterium]
MNIEDRKDRIIEITKDLLQRVGFEGEVKFAENGPSESGLATISIESDKDLSMLIGKNGQNLEAFERLVRLLVSRKLARPNFAPQNLGELADPENDLHFIIDVNDYRKSRTDYLVGVARDVARRVMQTQRAEALLPMSSYERRLVHTELASYKEVQTESVGQEPRRMIIVKPQPEQFLK